ALAVLASGAAAWAWLRPAPRPPAVPVVRFSLSFENGFQPTDFRGSPIALAPDGSRIVYAGTDSLGTRWLFSRGFARVEPALIPGTAGAGQPFFSPYGQSIGFWPDGRLRELFLSGGAVRPPPRALHGTARTRRRGGANRAARRRQPGRLAHRLTGVHHRQHGATRAGAGRSRRSRADLARTARALPGPPVLPGRPANR